MHPSFGRPDASNRHAATQVSHLRNALLGGASVLAILVAGPAVLARPLGGASTIAPTTAAANAALTGAQDAAAVARQSQSALTRATQAIQAMQAVQARARGAAASGPNNLGSDPNHPGTLLQNVPDGMSTIGAGGLVPKDGGTWVGANTPTQSTSSGLTTVTIQQTAPQALLNWTTFNVGRNTIVNFSQGASSW